MFGIGRKKEKNKASVQHKYLENTEVMWEILIDSMALVGWLSDTQNLYEGKTIKIVGAKNATRHAKLGKVVPKEIIEIKMERKGLGDQTFSFLIQEMKRGSWIDYYTELNFDKSVSQETIKKNQSVVINAFKSTIKDLDNLMRDEMTKKGYKPYF